MPKKVREDEVAENDNDDDFEKKLQETPDEVKER